MTLSASKLKDELLKVLDSTNIHFVGNSATIIAAANNWANAYDVYAKDATDLSGDAVVLTNKAGFASTLAAQIPPSPNAGSYATTANAFDLAFIAYWTAATFRTGTPPTPTGLCPNTGGNMVFGIEATSAVSVITPQYYLLCFFRFFQM
jgi:hypothetical protein